MEHVDLACHQKAMVLVAAQIAAVWASIAVSSRHQEWLRVASRWPMLLLATLLALLGIFLTSQGGGVPAEVSGWALFTAGAILLMTPMARLKTTELRRGLVQTICLLLVVAVLAPFMGYFSQATGLLVLLALILLAVMIYNLLDPSTPLNSAISAVGASLFAVWTIKDISERPCASPWYKSIQVFLDLLNVFTFSTVR